MKQIKLTGVVSLIFCLFLFSSPCESSDNFNHNKNIENYLEKLTNEPRNCFFLEQVASSYSALENYEEAIMFYFETIQNCPENYHALFQIGTCYYRTGHRNKAVEYMDKAISKANSLGDKKFAEQYIEEKNAWLKYSQDTK